jgi:RNA polymerase sigma-70 factor (ECF subfamily)
MVAVRLDRRLAARVDASDIVQEALADAARQLPDYLRDRPIPFYPWLRHFAWKRLIDMHRHHLRAQRRSVAREERFDPTLPGESAVMLADRLAASQTSPSRRMIRDEERQALTAAMGRLASRDREILVMRYLEQMSFDEVAIVLGLNCGAVKMRHMRALDRLRRLVLGESEEEEP